MSEEYSSFTAQSLANRFEELGADGRLLVAWSCNVFEEEFRVGLFEVAGSAVPELLDEGLLPIGELDALKALITERPGMICGRWDPFWATKWMRLWTEGEPQFQLWDNDTLLASIDSDHVLRIGVVEVVPAEVEAIERYVSEDWLIRGVRVLRSDADPVFVSSETDETPAVDPGYDRLDLEMECMWTLAMGKEIARQLGRPFVDSF